MHAYSKFVLHLFQLGKESLSNTLAQHEENCSAVSPNRWPPPLNCRSCASPEAPNIKLMFLILSVTAARIQPPSFPEKAAQLLMFARNNGLLK
jgi:hypothetical protein